MLVTAGCAMRADLSPLVIVTMFSEHDTADLRALFASFESLFLRGERYALIVDASHVKKPGTRATRAYIADWCVAHRAESARYNVATSVLGACVLVRGALTAVNWLVPFPAPLHHASLLSSAVQHCTERLRAARIELTPAARRFCERATGTTLDQFA